MTSIDEQNYESLIDESNSPEARAAAGELYEAMEDLPLEQKEAIILHNIMGFSREEICTIQNINLETLKARLYRGRKKLARLLGAEELPEDVHSTLKNKGVVL